VSTSRHGLIMAIETVGKVSVGATRRVCGPCGEAANDPHDWPSDSLAVKDRPTYRIQSEGSVSEVRRQRLLPVGATAEYLAVSRATVERLVYRGELPIVKVAGSTRYDVEDLDGYIEINRCRNRKRTV